MKPVIAARKPAKVKLEKGTTYYWCRCGRSATQPFCDGSHRGTDFTPLKFEGESDTEAYLCQCKHTANAPFCDGTHASLKAEDGANPPQSPAKDGTPNPVATPEEPFVAAIHDLAKHGLTNLGHHGEMVAMGVPRTQLPQWDDIQILPAQLATKPLLDDAPVKTETIIGKRAKKPLTLDIPLFVSDMSFGALSREAKTALATGADLAGTGICSGEGGMLPDEQAANRRYFYELASAKFGFTEEQLTKVQAFHFKGGQAAKTGTGGHLPGEKVTDEIAAVRNLKPGEAAISPATFTELHTAEDFKGVADRVREVSGGIPIGFKISANRLEDDLAFCLKASADYIIVDGRGGGTGAAPALFRDHISIPTMAALARARHFLDEHAPDVTLIITGGLRMAPDFIKALALGADAIAVSNSALQAIGCVGARMCNTNNCPAGIATQKPELRTRLNIEEGAERLDRFFRATTDLMSTMARACGHAELAQFETEDLTTWRKGISDLTGIRFAGLA